MSTDHVGISARALRIAVIEPAGEGGFAHFADQYCAATARAGAQVRLFTSSRFEFVDEALPYELDSRMTLWPAYEKRPSGGRLRSVLNRTRRRLRRLPRAARLAYQVWSAVGRALEWKPDVVQLTRSDHNVIAPFARRRCQRHGVFVAELVHELGDRENPRSIVNRGALRTLAARISSPDAFVVLSTKVGEALVEHHGVDAARIAVVPFGSAPIGDPDRALVAEYERRFATAHRPLILNFGTIRPSKGIPILLDAIALMPPGLEYTVLVAGHPTAAVDPDSLIDQASRLSLDDRVVFDFRFLDRIEVASLLEVASLVVLPYLSATQSAVLHQAQAQGVPVVASRVGALADEVSDVNGGRLVAAGDPSALADVLTELLECPSELARLAQSARSFQAGANGWAATGQAVTRAYRQWLSQRAPTNV